MVSRDRVTRRSRLELCGRCGGRGLIAGGREGARKRALGLVPLVLLGVPRAVLRGWRAK